MIAMCRRIGNFIEESGLGRLLIHVELFGPVTLVYLTETPLKMYKYNLDSAQRTLRQVF